MFFVHGCDSHTLGTLAITPLGILSTPSSMLIHTYVRLMPRLFLCLLWKHPAPNTHSLHATPISLNLDNLQTQKKSRGWGLERRCVF